MPQIHARSELVGRDDPVNGFINPPSPGSTPQDYSDNLVLKEGSAIDLTWITDFDGVVMNFTQVLECAGSQSGCDSTAPFYQSTTKPLGVSWVVNASPHDLSASNVFYFTIYNESASSKSASFSSHYFNISSSSPGAITADYTTQSISSSRELPAGAEIGIGIAIGFVACLVCFSFVLLFQWLRRRQDGNNIDKESAIIGMNSHDSEHSNRPDSRRPSWAESFEMRQNSPNAEHTSHLSRRYGANYDDEAPSYEHRVQPHERWHSPDDVHPEPFDEDEPSHPQDGHLSSPTDRVCEVTNDDATNYDSQHDSYANWTNPRNHLTRATSYESWHSQQNNDWLVPTAGLRPMPPRDSHTQKNPSTHRHTATVVEIAQPKPSYDPWRHHELLHRSASNDSIQHTPDQDPPLFFRREVKRGTPQRISTIKEGIPSQQTTIITSTPRPHLNNTPKRKSKENTTLQQQQQQQQQTPLTSHALQTPQYNISKQLTTPKETHIEQAMTAQRIAQPKSGVAELPDRQTMLVELEGNDWRYL
ncbi:hypothetical protein ACMFMG_007684 [Clarireedia jacksonii]